LRRSGTANQLPRRVNAPIQRRKPFVGENRKTRQKRDAFFRHCARLGGAKRANELERVLPNLKRTLIIEGAGHWVQQERPDEVNAALIELLK
jgi:pimeloyl-ACP methyl ester carboxylesterase